MVNGHQLPILGGAAAGSAPEPPPVGRVRAHVTRPLHATPDLVDRAGRAWLCDLEAARRARVPASAPQDALLAHWIVEAPWSHQVIHSVSLVLVHLRMMPGKVPVQRYLPNATHELHLRAINPQADRAAMLNSPINMGNWLEPIIFGAQIAEPTDEAATARVKRAVELICAGRLGVTPRHARSWAQLFGDNMLRVSAAPKVGDGQ